MIKKAGTEAKKVEKQKELIKKAATEAANFAKQKELIQKAETEEADVADVANQEDLSGQAATEAKKVAKQKELIKKAATEAADFANLVNRFPLIQKSGTEAADVAEGLRPSSLRAAMDAAIEDLRKGDTAKAKYFYEKSNEVIEKYYYGTDEQIAELKNMGYNRVNIEHLRNLNTEALRAIAEFKVREEKRANETEDDVGEYVGSEGI